MSARQFHDHDFVPLVRALTGAIGIDPSRSESELTETILIKDMDDTRSIVQRFKVIGVRISLDDFGPGTPHLTIDPALIKYQAA